MENKKVATMDKKYKAEAYLEPNRTSTTEPFCENSF